MKSMVNKAKKFILGLEWKRALRISLAVLLVNPAPLGVGVISARAQSVPAMMNFQGRLTDSLNNPLDGPYDFNFKIFDDPTAGTQLWEESQPGVAVANGVLAVRLGSVTPLTTSVFYNGAAYLEIKVGTDVLSPRERLITSPYAFGAKLLEGRSYDAFVSTDATAQTILGNKTFSGTVSVPEPAANSHAATKFYVDGQVASGGSGWIKDGSVVKLVASGDAVVVQSTLTVQGDAFSVGVSTLVVKDGRVGVGTINPGQPLEVNGTAQASRVFGTYTGSGGVFLAPGATGLSPQYTFVGSQGNGLGFEGQSTVLQGGWQSAESGIIFKTGTGSPTEWMRLNATGSVGIGTTAAQEKLHVSSGSAVVDFGIRTSTLTFAAGLTADPAPASGMLYYNAASNKLRLYNGAWADVTTGLSGDYVARTGDSMTGQLTVRGASVEVSSITTLGAIGIGGIGLSAGTLVVKSTSTDATNPVVNVQNFAGSELMRVQQDGKVGIGTTSPAQKLHVEGLCVAGDTLIPVLRAKTSVREIPITEIKPGDRVFSLNEKNSQIEPHPVKGLLYIGVKPVFRLTTASGRSIRTTGNHPYLTRSGWRKVVEIQVGEEIAVPGLEKPYWNSSKPSGLSTTSLPESLSGGIPVSREFSEEAMSSQYGGWKSIWMIPAHRDGGYRMVSVKSASRVIKSLFSWIASRMTEPFLSPSGTLFASWPSFFRNGRILTGTSSSMRNRMMGGSERNETAPLNALTREGQGGPDVRPGQGRIAGSDLSKTRPVLQELEDGRNHDARTLEAGLSVANLRVYGYKIPPVHSPSHPTNSLPTASKDVKEMRPPAVHWERIASIEPLGQEPVWDIEVERTHNFIGNRIFAHNTYMSGNVGIGTTSPAQKVHVSSGTLLVDGDASTAFKVGVSSFIINSEGRVGIGTTQPPTQLAIYHTTNAKAFIGVPTATDPDGSTTHKLLMGDSAGTGSGQLHLVTKTASANAWIGSVNFTNYNEATSLKNLASIVGQTDSAANKGRIGFWTTASGANNIVERMRIDGSGNVGIGTTDPQEKLHVSYGNAVVDYGIRTSTLTFAAGLTGDPATPASGMLYYNASTNKLRLYDGSWKDLATGSTGDYVSKAGDSMTGQLTVLGSSITIVDTNVGGSGDKYSLAVTTAPDRSVYHLYVSTTGRVGIGTSSVNSRSLFSVNGLTLYGKADQSNALVINNPGESWMIMRGIGSLGGWSALEMGYASTIDGTPTNILTLRDNGRAGIGTQSPAAKLDVNGGMIVRSSVTLAGISTTPNSAAGQGALYFDTEDGKFKVSENGGSFADLVNQASAGGWTDDGTVVRLSTLGDAVVVGNAATASSVTVTGALGIGGVGLSAGTLVVKSTSTDATNPVVNVQNNAGTELMRVQVDGKVGVGTTSPVEKLEVNGAIRVTSQAAQIDGSAAYTDYNSVLGEQRFFVHGKDAATRGSFLFVSRESDQGNQLLPLEMKSNGNIILAQTSGSIGVATTSPAAKLHLSSGTLLVDGNAATAFKIGVSSFIINSEGKVGVGTTEPAQKLQVVGAIFASGTTGGRLMANDDIVLDGGASGSTGSCGTACFKLYNIANATVFKREAVDVMTANDNGNVGIGTTSPNYKLDVTGGGLIVRSSVTLAGLSSTPNSASGQGAIYFDSDDNKFKVSENGGGFADLVTAAGTYVSRSGDSMTGQLTVRGTSVEVSSITTLGAVGIGGIGLSAGTLVVKSTSTDATNPVVNVQNNAGTELMRVQQDGKVGIGTTSPDSRLEINAGGGDGVMVGPEPASIFGANETGYSAIIGAVRGKLIVDNGATPRVRIGASTNHRLDLITNDLERVTLDTSGNVGVGAVPSARLHVSRANAAADDTILLISTGTDAGQELLVVKGDGRVGIGTTSPGVRLKVAGRFDMRDAYQYGMYMNPAAESPTIPDIRFTSNIEMMGTPYYVQSYDNLPLQLKGKGASGDIRFFIDTNEKVRLDSSGSLGIGTTAPGAKLDVDGVVSGRSYAGFGSAGVANPYFTLYASRNFTAPATANPSTGLRSDGTITGYATGGHNMYGALLGNGFAEGATSGTHDLIAQLYVAGGAINTAGGAATTDAATVYVSGAMSGAANNYALYSAGGANYFGGNVGIGTTAPATKLDLRNGSMVLTDDDVAHGFTGWGPADMAGRFDLVSATAGGLTISGFSDNAGTRGLTVNGFIDGTPTVPALALNGGKRSGTGQTPVAAGETVLGIYNGDTGDPKMVLMGSGNVGVGTTEPGTKLAIQGTGAYGSTNWGSASDMAIRSSEMTDSAYHSILQLVSIRQSLTTGNAANGYLGFSTIDDSNSQGMLDAGRIAIVNESGSSRNSATTMSFWTNAGGADDTVAATEKVRITSSGNVGIGTTSPDSPLEIGNNGGDNVGVLHVAEATAVGGWYTVLDAVTTADSGNILIRTGNNGGTGSLILAESNHPALGGSGTDAEFRVTNSGAVTADGSFTGGGADYAEYFYSDDAALKPGELVCVAGENKVKRCGKDGVLIGVVSGKPGVLGVYADDATDAIEEYAKDPHWVKVGLMGQVPVKVSLDGGPILPGDQLTLGEDGVALKGASPRTLLLVALEKAGADGRVRALIK